MSTPGMPREAEADMSDAYRLGEAVEILPMDTCAREQMFQVFTGQRRFQVNRKLAHVLESLKDGHASASVIAKVTALFSGDVDQGRLRAIATIRTLVAKGILVEHGQAPVPAEEPSLGRVASRHPLSLRLPLVSRRVSAPLTRRLAYLFERHCAIALVTAIVTIHACLYWSLRHSAHNGATRLGPYDAWWLVVALLVSIAVHELGHLSACERFGAKHGEVGIGLFFVWPVAYADVTDCWRLSRRQRVVVDVGGIYFHSLCSALFAVHWLSTGNEIALLAVHSITFATIMNLNPFLKFDGYWIVTDALGIPSLHRAMAETWEYATRRLSGRPGRRPYVLDTHAAVVGAFGLYATGTVLFVCYLTARFVLRAPNIVKAITAEGADLITTAARHDLGLKFWAHLLSVAMVAVPTVLVVRILIIRVNSLIHFVKRVVEGLVYRLRTRSERYLSNSSTSRPS